MTSHGVRLSSARDPLAQAYPCDDAYESEDGSTQAEYRSIPGAHFGYMPERIDRPDELASIPGVVFTGTRSMPNPLRTWHKVLLGTLIVGGALGVGALLFARPVRAASPPVPTEDVAVDEAIAQLGADAETSAIAQVAYAMAYPEGPLPPTGDYLPVWERIVATVQARLGRTGPTVAPPTVPLDVDDTSERVGAWLAELTADQQSETRDTLGPQLWDPMVRAAQEGNDLAARAALSNIKAAIELQVEESKFSALAMYSSLKSTLGDEKLSEFQGLMEDVAGPLEFNPFEPVGI